MKSRLLLPALIVLVLVVAACAPPPELRNDSLLHDKSIVAAADPCTAPCWQGITPGTTSWDEAIKVVENDPKLSDLQVKENTDTDNPNDKGAVWQEVNGQPCCTMYTEDGQTVQAIVLYLAPESTVSELVEAHGEPAYVFGSEVTGDQAVMNLIYLEPPMVVFAFVAGAENGALTATSELIGALYTTADQLQKLVEAYDLHGWQGYQSYKSYASSDFAVTAVPTVTPTQSQ